MHRPIPGPFRGSVPQEDAPGMQLAQAMDVSLSFMACYAVLRIVGEQPGWPRGSGGGHSGDVAAGAHGGGAAPGRNAGFRAGADAAGRGGGSGGGAQRSGRCVSRADGAAGGPRDPGAAASGGAGQIHGGGARAEPGAGGGAASGAATGGAAEEGCGRARPGSRRYRHDGAAPDRRNVGGPGLGAIHAIGHGGGDERGARRRWRCGCRKSRSARSAASRGWTTRRPP